MDAISTSKEQYIAAACSQMRGVVLDLDVRLHEQPRKPRRAAEDNG